MRVGDVVDAHAQATVAIGRVEQQGGDHFRVFPLAAGGRAVFAIAGDVENRPEFGLQLQGLADHLFRSGIVFAGSQRGERFAAPIQDIGGME